MSVEFELSGGVATILLNRPDKLNALSDVMLTQFAQHLERCARDDAVRSVILTGAGRAFCVGADIGGEGREARKPGTAGLLDLLDDYNRIIVSLYRLEKPVIAALRGYVVGFGLAIALCCDWLLVSDTAKLRPAFLNLAKVPEGGIIHSMVRLVGELKAHDILYRARVVTAQEAVEIALANRVVPDGVLMDEANTLAGELAKAPPAAFALSKRLFRTLPTIFEQFLEMEKNAIVLATTFDDASEGMRAFRDRREPKFGAS